MVETSDNQLTTKERIDRLMRRMLHLMFGTGLLATVGIWWMESRGGTLLPMNEFAYPVQIMVFAVCMLALWRWPRALIPVRWIACLGTTGLVMGSLFLESQRSKPMLGNYDAMTLLNWLPLCYALTFFVLEARQAACVVAAILAGLAGAALMRGTAPLPTAAVDCALLLNTLASHTLLVVCLTGLVWLKRVVTEQAEQARRLELLAGTDPLTGLANRRHTLRLLEALVRENRPDLAPVVLLCDLDHFKSVNDEFGHEMGDQVLLEVANALRRNTRETDTVARWGGEEFIVLLPRTRSGEPLELAERLRQCTQALTLRDHRGRPVVVTMSLGIAALHASDTCVAWLRRADEALYRAKDQGRNRCALDSDSVPTPRLEA